MQRAWWEWLGGLTLLLLLVSRYASIGPGELDDVAVLRAGAWLGSCPSGSAATTTLHEHLAAHAEGLRDAVRERYRLRMNFGTNYALTGPAIRTLEGSLSLPPLRAVEGACLMQHVLALVAVLAVAVGWGRWPWLLVGLLTGALATLWHWPDFLGSLLAFQRENMTWLASAPRGAAVTAWFGALLAALVPRSAGSLATVLGLSALSLLCHRSMALLCFASTLPLLALWPRFRPRLARWSHAPWPLVAFGAGVLAVAVLKLLLVLHYVPETRVGLGLLAPNGSGSAVRELVRLCAWAFEILVVLQLWQRVRTTQVLSDELRNAGDAIALLLGSTGAVALGLNLVNPGSSAWYGPLFFVLEASQRIGPVPQLLLLALAGLSLRAFAPAVLRPATLALAVVIVPLAAASLWRGGGATLPKDPIPLAQLLDQGEGAYSSEVVYYSSVAAQIAKHGCGAITLVPPAARETVDERQPR